MPPLQIDPLIALAVVLATAATDAIYVFTNSLLKRRRLPAATGICFLCSDQIHERLDLCVLRGVRLLRRRLSRLDVFAPRGIPSARRFVSLYWSRMRGRGDEAEVALGVGNTPARTGPKARLPFVAATFCGSCPLNEKESAWTGRVAN